MDPRRALAAFLLLITLASSGYSQTSKSKRQKSASAKQSVRIPQSAKQYDGAVVQRWLRGMTLRDKVAQLVVIPCYGESPSARSAAFREFAHAVRDLRVGGMIVVNRVANGSVRSAEPYAMAAFLNRMQKFAKVPLIVGADFERGASMRVSGTAKFPHLMAYGAAHDLRLTRELGLATAREARALGVQWVFAPDADVNNNPDNPIINTRSFGENPSDVAAQVKAFIEGAHSNPRSQVLLTVKHFPGHGDTNTDSHMGLPVLHADRARIDATEFVPFQAGIEAGVDSVMTAHLSAPALGTGQEPSTISKAVLTDVLRDQLKFSGLIVTDALDMGGITAQMSSGEAAVRVLQAGADVLLMPPNPEAVIKSVVAAVREGRLTEQRIQASVMRLLQAKARVGLQRSKIVNLEPISDILESQEFSEQAQTAANAAITLLRNVKSSVPLADRETACLYVLSESRYGQQGRRLLEEVRARSKGMRATLLDPQVGTTEIDDIISRTMPGCSTNVVAAFVTVGAYRGNVNLAGAYPELMKRILQQPAPVVMISLGSPYLLRAFPDVSSYLATFSTAQTAEVAAVKALFGEIPITGRSPVTIPGITQYGEGIQLSKR